MAGSFQPENGIFCKNGSYLTVPTICQLTDICPLKCSVKKPPSWPQTKQREISPESRQTLGLKNTCLANKGSQPTPKAGGQTGHQKFEPFDLTFIFIYIKLFFNGEIGPHAPTTFHGKYQTFSKLT